MLRAAAPYLAGKTGKRRRKINCRRRTKPRVRGCGLGDRRVWWWIGRRGHPVSCNDFRNLMVSVECVCSRTTKLIPKRNRLKEDRFEESAVRIGHRFRLPIQGFGVPDREPASRSNTLVPSRDRRAKPVSQRAGRTRHPSHWPLFTRLVGRRITMDLEPLPIQAESSQILSQSVSVVGDLFRLP